MRLPKKGKIVINDPLLNAKSWLTIEETAEYLSKHFGQEVTKGSIYQYALINKIDLSVISNQRIDATIYEVVADDEEIESIIIEDKKSGKPITIYNGYNLEGKKIVNRGKTNLQEFTPYTISMDGSGYIEIASLLSEHERMPAYEIIRL